MPEIMSSPKGKEAEETVMKKSDDDDDDLSRLLREQAMAVLRDEPELCSLLKNTVLAENVVSFEDAVAQTVCFRLLLQPCNNANSSANLMAPTAASSSGSSASTLLFCPYKLKALIRETMNDTDLLELQHNMKSAIRADAQAVCQRDPAVDSVLEVVLFSKGYAALVCHRAAYRMYKQRRKYTALFLQSQCSAVFGLDIHPAAQMGAGILLDHGTGIVIGETAVVGDNCTILHGVTLGGTGKEAGVDRHPKVGNNVLIGANASLLGNIAIGHAAKIGAGSVVLRAIPPHATAVGAPAKIIGRSLEDKPGSDVIDETLESVSLLHKSTSAVTTATEPLTSDEDDDNASDDNINENGGGGAVCPFREYARLAKLAPKHSVTICTLHKLLAPLGCSHNEIGSCLFALDVRNVGYVSAETFAKYGVDVILEQTRLDNRELVEQAVSKYLLNSTGMAMPMPDCGIGLQLDV